ncbi:MAG: hypothetical protein ACI4AM_07205, partial [Muribaculaceae bacterium]
AMAKRFRLTGPQLSGITFGLVVLLLTALAAHRGCSAPQQQTVVVVDTVIQPDTARKAPKKKRSRKPRAKKPATPPQQRDFLADTVVER